MDLDRYFSQLEEDERAYAQAFPLHALAAAYSSSAVPDDDRWLGRFKSLIAAGHDVNERCSSGNTVWDLLEPAAGASFHRLDQAASLLVQAGFNPLLHIPGKQLGKPCSFLSYRFMGAETGSAEEAIGLGAIRGLVECEKKAPLWSVDGGNFLHVMCQEVPEMVADVLEHFSPHPDPVDGRFAMPAQWLRDTDAHGMTPLALLWDQTGAIFQLGGEKDPGYFEISAQAIWDATQGLLETCDDLMESLIQGQPLWQKIDAHLIEQPALRSTMPAKMAAWLDMKRLEAHTAPAPVTGRTGIRL